MNISLELKNQENKKTFDFDLPATLSEMKDVLFKLDTKELVNTRGRIYDEFGRGMVSFDYEKVSLFEINHLAEKLNKLEHFDQGKFFGAVKILEKENPLSLNDTLNIVSNIEKNNIIDIQPAIDEYDLAEFHITNDLIPEIKELNDEQHQWIVDHVDYQSLGEEIMQKENGLFIASGYVTVTEKLENIYDGTYMLPSEQEYIFKMEIGLKEEIENGDRITVTLPLNGDIDNIARDLGESDFSKLNCYNFDSVVPLIKRIDFNMTDFEKLNDLAISIDHFKSEGELQKYTSFVDALEYIDLDELSKVSKLMDEFEYKEGVRSYSNYGKSKFENVLPEDLLECLDTHDYGKKLAEKNGVSITDYGVLVPNDGISLQEKLKEVELVQNFEMKMI